MEGKRLNFVLVLLLALTAQAFIFYAAFQHAGSGSALNFVSFAGTVTSIVLAVVAIVLAFMQVFDAKAAQNAMHGSIAELRAGLGELKKLEDVSGSLREVARLQRKTSSEVRQLAKATAGQFNKKQHGGGAGGSADAVSLEFNSAFSKTVLKRVLDIGTYGYCSCALALWVYRNKQFETLSFVESHLRPHLEAIDQEALVPYFVSLFPSVFGNLVAIGAVRQGENGGPHEFASYFSEIVEEETRLEGQPELPRRLNERLREIGGFVRSVE